MDFDIRAISLTDGVSCDAINSVNDCLGREIEFRSGIKKTIKLPDTAAAFSALPYPEKLLCSFNDWTRLYMYPSGRETFLHVLATAEPCEEESDMSVYRIDLASPQQLKSGPRPPVTITGGAILTYDECAEWLVNLRYRLLCNPDQLKHYTGMMRTPQIRIKPLRVGWVGPDSIGKIQVSSRLAAVGKVFGSEFIQVAPKSFPHVKAKLGDASLDAVIICSDFAPYITGAVAPNKVRADRVHLCGGKELGDLERQAINWINNIADQIEQERECDSANPRTELLRIMVKGMLRHDKIGQFNHCPKATLMKGIRARHLNVSAAERVLSANCEVFQETKNSDCLFLWKAHNDGDQYFLNVSQMDRVMAVLGR